MLFWNFLFLSYILGNAHFSEKFLEEVWMPSHPVALGELLSVVVKVSWFVDFEIKITYPCVGFIMEEPDEVFDQFSGSET